jgi:hypothetical protein
VFCYVIGRASMKQNVTAQQRQPARWDGVKGRLQRLDLREMDILLGSGRMRAGLKPQARLKHTYMNVANANL